MPRPKLPPARLDALRGLLAAKAARGEAIRRAEPIPGTAYLDPKPPRRLTVKRVPCVVVEFGLEVCHGPFPTREAAEDFVSGVGIVQFIICPLLEP